MNSEISEDHLSDFCASYNLKSLIKESTCFKNPNNPSCIDLILTNRARCFQNSCAIETGLSDFHKLAITVMKMTFKKMPPKIITYRNYKYFSSNEVSNDLTSRLNCPDWLAMPNDNFNNLVLSTLNDHAPLKQRSVRANDSPFVTKELRKEFMKRSRLKNRFHRNPNDISKHSELNAIDVFPWSKSQKNLIMKV